jgi:hypothetical protein
MKLGSGDVLEAAFFGNTSEEKHIVEVLDRHLDIKSLRCASRDGKGSKLK